MTDNLVERLTETFRHFPGTGPRQARRFVYHLLREGRGTIEQLATDLNLLQTVVAQCKHCFRFYSSNSQKTKSSRCDLCETKTRDNTLLMIVEKDADLEAVRQSGTYEGQFFVLGGLIPILEKNPQSKARLRELTETIIDRLAADKLVEVIVALAVNPEGDHTVEILKQTLQKFIEQGLRFTVLGRGLSTGTELEYSDTETIKNALRNRS